MVDIKGIPQSMADKAKDAAKNRNTDDKRAVGGRPEPTQLPADKGVKANPEGRGQDKDDAKNRDGQPPVRLATPGEEDEIKRNARKGDTVNKARDENDIERCRTAKDYETHTRLATPAEEPGIKARHAKKRAEAAGQASPPLSAKQQQAEADEAAASVARRQALGGV